jgi:hypothetical protein
MNSNNVIEARAPTAARKTAKAKTSTTGHVVVVVVGFFKRSKMNAAKMRIN